MALKTAPRFKPARMWGGAPLDAHFCPQCRRSFARPRSRLLRFLGLPRKFRSTRGHRAALPCAQPAVPSRLLLQRDAGRAARQPRAIVVPERRLPNAKQPVARVEYLLELEGMAAGGPQEASKQVPAALLEEVFALNEELDEIRELRARAATRPTWRARLERARAPIEGEAGRARSAARDLSAQWDALAEDAPGAATRAIDGAARSLLERNYINNLLAASSGSCRDERPSWSFSAWCPSREPFLFMSKVVGIDLGTTNSLVAFVQEGVPVVIRDNERRRAGALRRVDRRLWNRLRGARGAAPSPDRRESDGLFRQAVHGQAVSMTCTTKRECFRSGSRAGRQRRPHRTSARAIHAARDFRVRSCGS